MVISVLQAVNAGEMLTMMVDKPLCVGSISKDNVFVASISLPFDRNVN